MTKLIAALILASALAACTPQQFESAPVTVDTPQGPVTCQLYTKSLLDWDRSINRPAALSVVAADQICLNEGKKRR